MAKYRPRPAGTGYRPQGPAAAGNQSSRAAVEQLGQSRTFQELVEKTLVKVLTTAATGTGVLGRFLGAPGMGSMVGGSGSQPPGVLSGVAAFMGRVAGTVAAGKEVFDLGAKLGVLASGGALDAEALRLARQAQSLVRGNPQESARAQELARMRYTQEENRQVGLGALPGMEWYARRKDEQAGFNSRDVGLRETARAYRAAGMSGDSPAWIREQAAEQYYHSRPSGMYEKAYNSFGRPDKASEERITAAATASISRAKAMNEKFLEASLARRWQAAENFQREANRELPNSSVINPQDSYKMQAGAAQNNRLWVISNSPRCGSRDFD